MNDLTQFLAVGAVRAGLAVGGKKPLFAALGVLAREVYGLDERVVIDGLSRRERLGSTGFGAGVAIPHAKIADLRHVVGMFVRLAQPIDFAAADDLPVDLAFVLLSPVDAGADHLKALAQVSRALRDREFTAKLRGSASVDALLALMATREARVA